MTESELKKISKLSAKTPHRDAVIKLIEQETNDRVDLIEREFREGFEMINQYHNTVTIFGSARFLEDNKHYKKARKLAGMLAREGFTVVTGGGGGIMEAANRGAYEAGSRTIGFNIRLPHEQVLNSYVTDSKSFSHFFARKVMLAYAASALICFPGGFGTMDEMFEVITLVQTGKMPKVPIILVGVEFWSPLDTFVKGQMLTSLGAISHGDENIYHITDDLQEVKDMVSAHRETTSVFNRREPNETTK